MSARTDMFKRIADAMPQDAEVQEYCAKMLANASKSSEKTAARLEIARTAIKNFAVNPVTAKEFAHFVNSNCNPDQNWNTRTASFYLRELVKNGYAEHVEREDGKSGPKQYIYSVTAAIAND